MKRIIAIMLPMALVFIMAACASKPVEFDEDTVNANANELTNKIFAHDFESVYASFNKKMAKSISAEQLSEVWLQTAGDTLENGEIRKSEYTVDDKYATVSHTVLINESGVLITYSFENNTTLSGIWFKPTTIEGSIEFVNNENFQENPIKVGALEEKMDGILTLPKNVENPPVVILVHGSGTTDMNETIGKAKNKPFRDIAHGLALEGVASIRYDKRYYTFIEQLQIDFPTLTINDEVLDDVTAAIKLAATDGRVDPNNIYIIGHSLGGMLLPKIATDNSEVKGIISIAGTLRKMEDLILMQNQDALESNEKLTEKEKEETLTLVKNEIERIKALDTPETEGTIFNYPASYWFSMSNIDSTALVKELTIPMLFLQGNEDFQVSPVHDFPLWEEAVGGRDNTHFVKYDGLNHLLMKTNGIRNITDYDTPNTVSETAIDDIAEFVNTNSSK